MIRILLLALLTQPGLPQAPKGSIAGQILTGSGVPAASVRVAAMPMDPQAGNEPTLAAQAITDSSGRYRMDGIDAGTYYVTAGLVSQPTYYPGVGSQAGARAVTVAEGAAVNGLDFKVVTPLLATSAVFLGRNVAPLPTFSVAGRIVLKPGQQVPPELRVALTNGKFDPVRPDGSFELNGVPPGSYRLQTSLWSIDTPVTVVVVDKNVTGVAFGIPFTGLVIGKIESKTEPPGAPLSLSLRNVADPLKRMDISSASSLALELPEGEYRVSPARLPAGYHIDSITAGTTNLQKDVLKVSRGESFSIVVQIDREPRSIPTPADSSIPRPLREVTGRLEVEGTSSSALAVLRLVDPSGTRTAAILDISLPNPVFKLAAPEGEYTVDLQLPGVAGQANPFRVKSLAYGSFDILSKPLRITAEPPGEIRIVLAPASP